MKRIILRALLIVSALVMGASGAAVHATSQTCPTSGAKQLATASTPFITGAITAPITPFPSPNTGVVCVGDASVTASPATGGCIIPGGSVSFFPMGNASAYNLRGIYIACTVATDTVTIFYVQ